MQKYDLSIAIPTYNGACSLKQVLEAFNTANLDNLNIEIIISDNCSNDSTKEICKNFIPNQQITLKYNCNTSNIGYDRNVIKAVGLASSDYVWICSDNEVLVNKDGIKKIVEIVRQFKPSFLFLEHDSPIDTNCKNVYYDTNEFFLDTKFKSGLISNCVVNKSIFCSFDYTQYLDKQWIHFAYQILALSPNNKNNVACVLNDCIFKSIQTTRTWGNNGSFIDIGLLLQEIFLNLKPLGYSKEVIRLSKLVIKGGYPENLLIARQCGYKFSFTQIKLMQKYYKAFPSFYLVDIPVMILPKFIAKLIIKLYKH